MDSNPRPQNEVVEENASQSTSPLSAADVTPTMSSTAGSGTITNSPVEPAQAKVETDADENIDMTSTPSTQAPTARVQERARFNEPTNLPREDQSLNDDQLIQLMYCAPTVRKNYTINFDKFGYLKTPWRKLLFEMDENGETRHPMPIIKSNVPGADCKLAGIRRRAQAAKDLEAKKRADELAKSTAKANDRAQASELERQAIRNVLSRTAKRSQDQSPDTQNGSKAKKPKPSSQPERPVAARPGRSAETITSTARATIPTLELPHPYIPFPPRRNAETIVPAFLSTSLAPPAFEPSTPLSVPRSSPSALATVDDGPLGNIAYLFEDYIPTPHIQSNGSFPPNEPSTAPGTRVTSLPNEEINEIMHPQPQVGNSDVGNPMCESESFDMDALLASGRANLANWIDVQARRLHHHLAGADSDTVNPEYQSRVTKVIIQMYQLRNACMKLNGVDPVESIPRAG